MNLFDKIDDILDQEEYILPKKEKIELKINVNLDEEVFGKMADLIINLNPEKLNDSQIEDVLDMIEELGENNIQERGNAKLANMSTSSKNQYSKKWYNQNKEKIKKRKQKFRRSSEGRKRENTRERLSRQGKTETGRDKTRYHVRKRSDRKDRERNLN